MLKTSGSIPPLPLDAFDRENFTHFLFSTCRFFKKVKVKDSRCDPGGLGSQISMALGT
jgi:hypothetical protein